ncbi:MAG: RHS repeat-associated core domain-containing protein [Nitrospiraceae bacterium]
MWRWDQAEPFGNNPADEDPDANSVAFDLPLRLPGQRYDAETGLHYNYYRDLDPSLGIYLQSDPIGLFGGINTFMYALGMPLTNADPRGLEVEVGVRPFYPVELPLVRHCFVRFNKSNSDTLSFSNEGVTPDPNPGAGTYSPAVGPENDTCVRKKMNECRDWALAANNCCDCVAVALESCGLTKAGSWPNRPLPVGPASKSPCNDPEQCVSP